NFVFVICILMLLIGCNKENVNFYVSSDKANSIAFEYIELQNETYVLNLSEEEAEALRISSADFQRIRKDIMETNNTIKDFKQTNDAGNFSLCLSDFQDCDVNFMRAGAITRSESKPDGNGYIADDQYMTIWINVPKNCKSITMNLYSNSIVGFASSSLYYGGQPYSSGAGTSSYFTGSCSINMSVPVGGESYKVVLRVSSSFGGSYYYNFNY
ncbi:hypothetical protein, partial [Bacteroides heparinolyticus]|uniref:hypothetical protein n=1 Tax=Prevotella heparinolytica TaxID=28113 RepID=UPI00359F5035